MFWFIVSVILLVLLLKARDNAKNASEASYGQGYWDGYRAFGDKARELLKEATVDKKKLNQFINEGEGIGITDQESVVESESKPDAVPITTQAQEVDQYQEALESSAVEQEDVIEEKPVRASHQSAKEKERVTLRNLNTLLYMGSFLLVAAAATFIAAAMPEMVRLIGLIIVVILFYGAGIILHIKVPRLRPAAIAFTGTGLAILPFVGIALTMLGGMDASLAWLTISIIGLGAYSIASIVLQSQVVSYLTMAFVLSLASATVATAQASIMWYFIALIGVSLISASVSNLWPDRVPKIFRQPIETTGQVVTPVALVASLFVVQNMQLYMYEILYGLGAAHYLVAWLQQRKYLYETAARVLAHVALLVVGWDIFVASKLQGAEWFGVWWAALATGQAAYSIFRIKTENARIYQGETAQLIFAQIWLALAPMFWSASTIAAPLTTCSLIILAAVSFITAYRLRNQNWGYVGLIALWILPFIVGREMSDPAWPWSVFVILYTILASASLAGYKLIVDTKASDDLKRFFTIATATYAITAALMGAISSDQIVLGWSLMLSGVVAVMYSFIAKARSLEVVGVALGAAGVFSWVGASAIHTDWRAIVAVLAATATAGLATLVHEIYRDDEWRRNALLVLTIVGGALLWVAALEGSDVTRQAALVLLLVGAIALLGLRVIAQQVQASAHLQSILTGGYMTYIVLAWFTSLAVTQPGFVVATYTVVALMMWVGSHIERQPLTLLAGNAALLAGLFIGWRWLELNTEWQTFGVVWIAAAVYFVMYGLYAQAGDRIRQWVQLLSAWALLVIAVLLVDVTSSVQFLVAAIATIVVSGLVLIVQGYRIYGKEDQQPLLRIVTSVAIGAYIVIALTMLGQSLDLAAWAFALAAIFSIWHSYVSQQAAMEAVGAGIGVAAIASWAGLASFGVWYGSIVIAIAVSLVLLAVLLHQALGQSERRDAMLAVALTVFAGFVLNGMSGDNTVVLVGMLTLAAGAVLAYGARWIRGYEEVRSNLSQLYTIGYVAYILLAWILSWSLMAGWQVAICALAAIILWSASHIERIRPLVIIGQILVAVVVVKLWQWLEFNTTWEVFGIGWIVAACYYIAYWVYTAQRDTWRQAASFAMTLIALLVTMAIGLSYGDVPREIAVAATFIVAAAVVGIHGYIQKNLRIVEVAVYCATFGLQRVTGLLIPEINGVVYAHWWAIVIAIIAFWRNQFVGRRLGVAMAILTMTLAGFALREGGIYQMLFLAEHIVLLIAGALLRKQWAVWWGIIASVGAILYFIKDYTFLWLGVLGLSLIALVVWRLTKIGKPEER